MQTATVFDIQRFSIHDGPGIRTAVFLKGCPLRCEWCHNPEGLSPKPQLARIGYKCTLCGRCAKVCQTGAVKVGDDYVRDDAICTACGKCARVCVNNALKLYGEVMSCDEVFNVVRRDEQFYTRSGGGVTLSGGEPLLQADFCAELLKQCRDSGYSTAIETSGFVSYDKIEKILPYTELFLYDIKMMDGALHRKHTGQDNALILENFIKLRDSGANIIVRVPVIPSVNDSPGQLDAIREFAGVQVEHMPFHRMAQGKYESLGMRYKYSE